MDDKYSHLEAEQWSAMLRILRDGRAIALQDAESFHRTASSLEHIGQILSGEVRNGLARYEPELCSLAKQACQISHERIDMLFEIIRLARNKAVHEGAFVRHHSKKLVEFILVLEEAIMKKLLTAGDLMVSEPCIAMLWQNIATVRRTLLANSFTHLPVFTEEKKWCLVSDDWVIRFLNNSEDTSGLNERLGVTLGDALRQFKNAPPKPAATCGKETRREELIERLNEAPFLVVESEESRLLGLITPFDLL